MTLNDVIVFSMADMDGPTAAGALRKREYEGYNKDDGVCAQGERRFLQREWSNHGSRKACSRSRCKRSDLQVEVRVGDSAVVRRDGWGLFLCFR